MLRYLKLVLVYLINLFIFIIIEFIEIKKLVISVNILFVLENSFMFLINQLVDLINRMLVYLITALVCVNNYKKSVMLKSFRYSTSRLSVKSIVPMNCLYNVGGLNSLILK